MHRGARRACELGVTVWVLDAVRRRRSSFEWIKIDVIVLIEMIVRRGRVHMCARSCRVYVRGHRRETRRRVAMSNVTDAKRKT